MEPPKRWINVTAPVLAFDFLSPAFLLKCWEMAEWVMFKTRPMSFGRIARSRRSWMGKLITHCRTGLTGSTWSTRWMALSLIRLPPQLGQRPRRLHENATRRPFWQLWHCTRTKPWARIPHLRYSLNSFTTKSGSGWPVSSWTRFRKVSRFSCTIW